MKPCPDYQIGTTVALLKDVTWYGIPYPTHTYVPYAVVRRCGNASEKGYGFPVATWFWRYLSQDQLYNVLDLFDNDTDASMNLYVRTYKDTGTQPEVATFLAEIYRPLDGQGKTPIPYSRAWFSNITLRIEHMVEQ